jgi:hypothetical protein
MNKEQAASIFRKYNPKEKTARCPNKRAAVREALDRYAKAAVNLYGIISKRELVDLFNGQNQESTSEGELFALLLPLVFKSAGYCFYKDYIVDGMASGDFGYADSLLQSHEGKPRYSPEKEEFLRFAEDDYEDSEQARSWNVVIEFLEKLLPDAVLAASFVSALKTLAADFPEDIAELSESFVEFGPMFGTSRQVKKLVGLLTEAHSNTRFPENNGHTPKEIMSLDSRASSQKDLSAVPSREPRPEDPCPCGSGKRHDNCCLARDDACPACLSGRERGLFFEAWFALISYVDRTKKVNVEAIKPEFPTSASFDQILKARNALWEDPGLIDGYVKSGARELNPEIISILESWRRFHRKGNFIVLRFLKKYAVVIGADKGDAEMLYGVHGISQPLSHMMFGMDVPAYVGTVLLPFNGKIISDGFLAFSNIRFGGGIKRSLRQQYSELKKGKGIVTSFE